MIKYYAFTKVIELKSITKAAEALGYSQPGLSHILKAFEEELGFPLLIKNKKSIEPTENGKRILPYCYELIDAERRLMNEAETIETQLAGAVRVGTPNSMLVGFVSYLITRFTQAYKDIDLTISEDTLENVEKKLQDGSIDVAFLTEEAAESRTKFFPLFEDAICLAVHKNNPLAEHDRIPLDVLKTAPLICNPPGWDDITKIVIKSLSFQPNIKYYSASDFAALAMVQSDLGVYVVSSLQKNLLPRGVVMRRFDPEITRTVGVAAKSMKTLTSVQRAFVQTSINAFSQDLHIPSYRDVKFQKQK